MIKYEDIVKFQSDGRYNIDIQLKDVRNMIHRYEDEYDLELYPDFQRGNVWTDEQRTRYMEFLLRGGTSANTIYFNHPSWDDTMEGQMVCLDGLQRLTTILMFLDGNVKVFGDNTIDDFEDKGKKFLSKIWLKFNVNNMKTKEEVLNWYIDHNSGGTVHSEEEINCVRSLLKEEQNKKLK